MFNNQAILQTKQIDHCPAGLIGPDLPIQMNRRQIAVYQNMFDLKARSGLGKHGFQRNNGRFPAVQNVWVVLNIILSDIGFKGRPNFFWL